MRIQYALGAVIAAVLALAALFTGLTIIAALLALVPVAIIIAALPGRLKVEVHCGR